MEPHFTNPFPEGIKDAKGEAMSFASELLEQLGLGGLLGRLTGDGLQTLWSNDNMNPPFNFERDNRKKGTNQNISLYDQKGQVELKDDTIVRLFDSSSDSFKFQKNNTAFCDKCTFDKIEDGKEGTYTFNDSTIKSVENLEKCFIVIDDSDITDLHFKDCKNCEVTINGKKTTDTMFENCENCTFTINDVECEGSDIIKNCKDSNFTFRNCKFSGDNSFSDNENCHVTAVKCDFKSKKVIKGDKNGDFFFDNCDLEADEAFEAQGSQIVIHGGTAKFQQTGFDIQDAKISIIEADMKSEDKVIKSKDSALCIVDSKVESTSTPVEAEGGSITFENLKGKSGCPFLKGKGFKNVNIGNTNFEASDGGSIDIEDFTYLTCNKTNIAGIKAKNGSSMTFQGCDIQEDAQFESITDLKFGNSFCKKKVDIKTSQVSAAKTTFKDEFNATSCQASINTSTFQKDTKFDQCKTNASASTFQQNCHAVGSFDFMDCSVEQEGKFEGSGQINNLSGKQIQLEGSGVVRNCSGEDLQVKGSFMMEGAQASSASFEGMIIANNCKGMTSAKGTVLANECEGESVEGVLLASGGQFQSVQGSAISSELQVDSIEGMGLNNGGSVSSIEGVGLCNNAGGPTGSGLITQVEGGDATIKSTLPITMDSDVSIKEKSINIEREVSGGTILDHGGFIIQNP